MRYTFAFNIVVSLWTYYVYEAGLTSLTYSQTIMKEREASLLELKSLPLNVHDETKATGKQYQQNIQK